MSRLARFAAATVAVVVLSGVLGACWLGMGPESLPTTAAAAGRRLTAQLAVVVRLATVATTPHEATPGGLPENHHRAAQAEHETLALLAAGEAYVERWDLEKAEEKLAEAARLAEQQALDLEKGHAADPSLRRAFVIAADALTRLGTFRTRYGEPSEAVPQLRHALELVQPAGSSSPSTGEPTALALRARAEAALGHALCITGGGQGSALLEAGRHFGAAAEAAHAARRAQGDGYQDEALVALETRVRADRAECLLTQGEVAAAKTEVEMAAKDHDGRRQPSELGRRRRRDVAGAAAAGPTALRLLAVRGMVRHEEAKFSEALQLYDAFLAGAPAPELGDDPTGIVEVFEVTQAKAYALSSMDRIDEGLALLDKAEAAQRSVQAELLKKTQTFLKVGSPDRSLWESIARTHFVRASLLLDKCTKFGGSPSCYSSLTSARTAVGMLRTYERSRVNLADGLNVLGGASTRLHHYREAASLYEEALKIDAELYGEDSVIVAALLQNLATAKEQLGNYKEALALLRRSLERDERVLGFANPDTSMAYSGLAKLLEKMGDKAGALEAARRAAESARLTLPEGHEQRDRAEQMLERLAPKGAVGTLPGPVVVDVSVVRA